MQAAMANDTAWMTTWNMDTNPSKMTVPFIYWLGCWVPSSIVCCTKQTLHVKVEAVLGVGVMSCTNQLGCRVDCLSLIQPEDTQCAQGPSDPTLLLYTHVLYASFKLKHTHTQKQLAT